MASRGVTDTETSIADYGLSSLLVTGLLGNTLVMLLFRRYRRNVSSMYLSTGALFNILYLSFNIPLIIYSYHSIDPRHYSVGFCKFQSYFSLFLGQSARYIIVFACLDRYLATNRRFVTRSIDRVRLAKRFLCLVVLMWAVLATHRLVLTKIQNGVCSDYGSYFFTNRILQLVSFNTVPPALMAIFGYLAFSQIRHIHRCVRPFADTQSPVLLCRKDRKFLVMILTEVGMYLLTTLLYLVMTLHLVLKTGGEMQNSLDLSDTESVMILCSVLVSFVNHVAPFYLYLGLSREFRHDFLRLITGDS